MRLLITGGGTGGHVSPGLAVATAWEKKYGKGSAAWAGRSGGIEERMALAAGVAFHPVQAQPFKRALHASNLGLPWSLFKGFGQAWRLLKEVRPSALLMTGGYAGVPGALAAVLQSLPLVLLEPNAALGAANRFFSGAAEAVCLGWPLENMKGNMVLTGNPVRFGGRLPSRDLARKKLGFPAQKPLLFVIPGSGAAHSVNVALKAALKKLEKIQILWMTGPKDHQEMRKAAEKSGIKALVVPFIDDVATAYAAADLVLARSGASMISEIAIAAKPSILVPYPHAAGDHQHLNASVFASAGAARMIDDAHLSGELLAGEINGLLGNGALLKRMAKALRGLARPDAAEAVAGVLARVAKGFSYV
jgi:UDP-N-acetylglucosamine--N-acetylmuramyl-(pentapeptide) pyrophosphoryl-undecaprenol N-acetylglucosamine transferase